MKKIIPFLAVACLLTGAFIARSDWWIVPDINRWQASMMGDNRYFPMLTAFILTLPILLPLALLHWWLKNKQNN